MIKKIALLIVFSFCLSISILYCVKITPNAPFKIKWNHSGLVVVGEGTQNRKILLYKENHVYDYEFSGQKYKIWFINNSFYYKTKQDNDWNRWIPDQVLTKWVDEQINRDVQIKIGGKKSYPKSQTVYESFSQPSFRRGKFSAPVYRMRFFGIIKAILSKFAQIFGGGGNWGGGNWGGGNTGGGNWGGGNTGNWGGGNTGGGNTGGTNPGGWNTGSNPGGNIWGGNTGITNPGNLPGNNIPGGTIPGTTIPGTSIPGNNPGTINTGTGNTGITGSQNWKFGNNCTFFNYPPRKNVTDPGTWGSVLTDIESHIEPSHGTQYRANSKITWGHETTHGINSDIRNNVLKVIVNVPSSRKQGLYVLSNRGVAIKEPLKIRKSSVGQYIPRSLRGNRFNLYINGMNAWDDTPTYILDEWVAYTNGAKVGIELVNKGKYSSSSRSDDMYGPLEFTIYSIALAMAVEKGDPAYFQKEKQLLEFIAWHGKVAMDTFRVGIQLNPFVWQDAVTYYGNIKNSADADPVRKFAVRVFGNAWVNEVLYGQVSTGGNTGTAGNTSSVKKTLYNQNGLIIQKVVPVTGSQYLNITKGTEVQKLNYNDGQILNIRFSDGTAYDVVVVNNKASVTQTQNGSNTGSTGAVPGISSFEKTIFDIVNKERTRAGVSQLKLAASISDVARDHSKDMNDRRFFSHTNPDGLSASGRARKAGINIGLGENIIMGYSTPESMMRVWMNSSGHKRNILSRGYKYIGVGHYKGRNHYCTQVFCSSTPPGSTTSGTSISNTSVNTNSTGGTVGSTRYTDFNSAKAEAIRLKRPLVVVLSASWCSYCQKLKSETLQTQEFTTRCSNKFVFAYLTSSSEYSQVPGYSGGGIPQTYIFDRNGRNVKQLTGYVPKAQFLGMVDQYAK